MKKIIFLDFDGVLNTEHYQGLLRYQGEPWQDEHGAVFDPNAVKELERIVNATHADIVIESSWKYLGLVAMQELWKVRNLPGRVIDITPTAIGDRCLLGSDMDNIYLEQFNSKGREILAWLSTHGIRDIRYVIIDDEYVILDSQLPYFILTNPYEGITKEHADRVISILNG